MKWMVVMRVAFAALVLDACGSSRAISTARTRGTDAAAFVGSDAQPSRSPASDAGIDKTLRDASLASPDASQAKTFDAGIVAPDAGRRAGCGVTSLGLCDDFESTASGAAPDPQKWRVITSYSGQPSSQNRVTVDGAHAARGAHALHVHTETNDPVYLESVRLPLANDGFYGRVMAYFAADPGARSKGHWGAFVGVGKKNDSASDIEVRIGGQFDILVVNYSPTDALQISSSRDGYYDDGVQLPIGTFTCFEFQFAGASDEVRVWMNGVEITQLHVTDWNQFGHGLVTNWSPAYDRLRIGYQSWNADTPIDVWYDDVVVDTERVGCE